MKIKNIDFPKPLLDALHANKLVVFAGAGVSMGDPAHLPNFKSLTDMIAQRTGKNLRKDEKFEEFLGRLHDDEVKVHEIAAGVLSQESLQATKLHKNLLQLYPNIGPVRLVTTNFDLLFEQAAEGMFDSLPEVFRAPALPLGRQFNGIIHVHGSVSKPGQMVLTDKDFGLAYLTDGWARHFLVELFSNFTILFVGYSHDDTIMNYLARALPAGSEDRRFVLTGSEDSKKPGDWRLLGIHPITYPQTHKEDHSKLETGVRGLANHVRRSVVDWHREITAIAENPPPLADDEKIVGTIEEALGDKTKTQFFTKAASNPDWIDWLDEHGCLKALFGSDSLRDQDMALSWWVADRFLYDHANRIFLLISKYDTRLHPKFWHDLARKIGRDMEASRDKVVLSRWISLLLSTAPSDGDSTNGVYVDTGNLLDQIGKRCIAHGMLEDLLRIFDTMMQSRLLIRGGYPLLSDDGEEENLLFDAKLSLIGKYGGLNKLWEGGLRPNLFQVAEPLLESAVRRLEEWYLTLHTWGKANRELEPASIRRSAIEPHEQDRHPQPVDAIIDVVRDCLESLALNQQDSAARWCDKLVQSDAPLLRRLAVHGLSIRTDLSPDDKIQWLQEHIDLHEYAIHHEIFQAVYQAYPKMSSEHRKTLIEAVRAYRWQHEDCEDDRKFTSRVHFDWLHWLHKSDPTCQTAKQALNELQAEYPDFEPKKYPDLTSWIESGWGDLPNSWTSEELLSRPTSYWLDKLLSTEDSERNRPRFGMLINSITEATEQDFAWGLSLADELDASEKWDSELWYALIRAWSKMALNEDKRAQVVYWLGRTELYAKHCREIADALCTLVKNGGLPYSLNLLHQANEIAATLWRNLDRTQSIEEKENWLDTAMNHPAGCLAYFWMSSFFLWREQQDPKPTTFSDEYLRALSDIMVDQSLPGRLARTVLASQLHFLLTVDEGWTRDNVLPLFEPECEDFQAAWDGFARWGNLNPAVAEAMAGLFLKAVTRISNDLPNQCEPFIRHYTDMLAYFAEDPLCEWIPKLFQHSNQETKDSFASAVGNRLQYLAEAEQQDVLRKWWISWLKPFWMNRLQGMFAKLEPGEISHILDWLPHLTPVFPEAVDLAIQMPRGRLQPCWVLDYLRESNLWQKHPESIAKLILYLWECEFRFTRLLDQEFIDSLLQADVSLELKKELEDIKIQL